MQRSSTKLDYMPVLPLPLSTWPSAFKLKSECVATVQWPTARASSPCCNWEPNMAQPCAFRLRDLTLPPLWMRSRLVLPWDLETSQKNNFPQLPAVVHTVGC